MRGECIKDLLDGGLSIELSAFLFMLFFQKDCRLVFNLLSFSADQGWKSLFSFWFRGPHLKSEPSHLHYSMHERLWPYVSQILINVQNSFSFMSVSFISEGLRIACSTIVWQIRALPAGINAEFKGCTFRVSNSFHILCRDRWNTRIRNSS